jgi:hypothetical protein
MGEHEFVAWKDAPWILVCGVFLFAIQILGLLAWIAWSSYQLTLPAEKTLNNINALQVLTSMYPFAGASITMVPILEEIARGCQHGTCSVQHKYVWFLAPLVSTPVYAVLFASNYKLYPQERQATIVMGWNAVALAATTVWTGLAFGYFKGNIKPARKTEASVEPLSIDWGLEKGKFGTRRLAAGVRL